MSGTAECGELPRSGGEHANVEISVGLRCNNRCIFCLNTHDEKLKIPPMAFDDMRAEIQRWAELGHDSIGFVGGEPTIYPHIVSAVDCARAQGFTRIAISTNISRLHDSSFADRLLEAGLTRVSVSMHGHTPELEDTLTGVPGNFEKKVKAVRYLLRRHEAGQLEDGLSINLVLTRLNAGSLLQIQRFFFRTLGIRDLRINFVRPEGEAAGRADLTPRFFEVVGVAMRALAFNELHYRRTLTLGGFPFCVLPRALLQDTALLARYLGEYRDLSTDCSISPDGCGAGVSVEDGRARFNWQERKRGELKSRVPACAGCRYVDHCEGVWKGYLDLYGAEELVPVAPGDTLRKTRLTKPARSR